MVTKAEYNALLAEGLCPRCGRERNTVDTISCTRCLQRDRVSYEERKKRINQIQDGTFLEEIKHSKSASSELFLDPKKFRVGVLDIEASGLTGGYHIIFCCVVKIFATNEWHIFKINTKRLDILSEEKKMLMKIQTFMERLDGVITYYGCLTPGHRILTNNLKWVPVENLRLGDKLLAFDEKSINGKRRQFRESVITGTGKEIKTVIKIKLSDGTSLTSTPDHPWLIERKQGNQERGPWEWIQAQYIKPGMEMRKLIPTWKTEDSREAGWLAAFFDSEGSFGQYETPSRYGKYNFNLSASQNENSVLSEAEKYMKNLGFNFGISSYDSKNPKVMCIKPKGGVFGGLKFLGSIRPKRLLSNFNIEKLGSIQGNHPKSLQVVDISYSTDEVITLGTSTGTYFAEGFGSHNTNYDVPMLRTRMLFHGIDPFPKLKHLDMYYTIRRTVNLERRRMVNVNELLNRRLSNAPEKTRIGISEWTEALYARSKEAIDYIIDHCVRDVEILNNIVIQFDKYIPDRILRK